MATTNSYRMTPTELEATIIKIASDVSPGQVAKPDLEDDQKRWLVVGICLHSIISPTLRQYVAGTVNMLYGTLKRKHSIHSQTYPTHMKKYPPTKKELNYESINNNNAIQWVRRKRDLPSYNYKVMDAVDLSKLFLVTHMAHYTGFDDSCDSSALLGIIINIDTFPQAVKGVAEKIRSEVRNKWAHCNFGDWDIVGYMNSFKLMHQLIKHLQLTHAEETRLLGELNRWEINGIHFLQGTTIGLEILQDIKTQTCALAEYALQIASKTTSALQVASKTDSDSSENFQKVHEELSTMQKEINSVVSKVDKIETQQTHQQNKLLEMCDDITTLKQETTSIQSKQHTFHDSLASMESEISNTTEAVKHIDIASSSAHDQIRCIESQHKNTTEDISKMKDDIHEMKGGIEDLKKYTSYSRPEGKLFFYPPNRLHSFVGREDELEQLKKNCVKNAGVHYTQAISGLGGCGKTSLSIEYAWVSQAFYPGGVFWMSGESSATFEDSITKLAIDANTNGKHAKETLYNTLKWLANLQQRWLLLVDNVDGEDISGNIKELLLGTWKRTSLGHIVITSRRETSELKESLDVNSNDVIGLEVFTRQEGVLFMKKRAEKCESFTDNEHISELVEELGGLPLALEQAAAHIRSLNCSFPDYMKRFERKRLKLLRTAKVSFEISKERLAVLTTWQLNIEYIEKQSDEEGLGTAAISMMQIAAFLFADKIPKEVVNSGKPQVDDEDMRDAFEDCIGVEQVIEILTRFSLFQRDDSANIFVHRLVQEVIRENIKDDSRLRLLLQSATRMINKALMETARPFDVLSNTTGEISQLGSLQLWSTLANNANVLKAHLMKFSHMKDKTLCLNLETTKILQTTSIYHSLHQRQDEALADQGQMLQIVPKLDLSEVEYEDLTCIKIPILCQYRTRFQNSLAGITGVFHEQQPGLDYNKTLVPLTPNILRLKGNDAFKEKRYQDAIKYYTQSLRASPKNVDFRVLANRSLQYLRLQDYENALLDANRCIELDPGNWKGYCWKAYAVYHLIRNGSLPSLMEAVGLASACIAAYINKDCLLEYKMKIYYPVVVYKIIEKPHDLGKEICSLVNRPFTTLMLRQGNYSLSPDVQSIAVTTKSIQVIGMEEGVHIDTGLGIRVIRPSSSMFRLKFEPERQIHVHFENVFFISGGQISVGPNAIATFYRCKFSNGDKGCDGFPRCMGGAGCANTSPKECKQKYDSLNTLWNNLSANTPCGKVGSPSLISIKGGKSLINNCVFDRCGGGGVLSDGDGSFCDIKNTTFCNMRQQAVEARNDGTVHAINNVILDNQFHGVVIGPKGNGVIRGNAIQRNGQEGIWSGGRLVGLCVEAGSTAVISDNIICQNGLSGITLDGGSFEVSGNKIFDNWLWGMMVKSDSATQILNNEIFDNKCGGIRVGINYSSPLILDGNTIRNHSGPGVCVSKFPYELNPMAKHLATCTGVPLLYSKAPTITNRNEICNNERGVQHPRKAVQLIKVCSSCREPTANLKTCSKCKITSYCSKECQSNHWKRHKHMCKLLQAKYTIEIKMKDTQPSCQTTGNAFFVRHFHLDLKGIAEGPSPDRKQSKKFIVKVQSGKEYSPYDPKKSLLVYDQSVTLPGCLDVILSNAELYHLVNECGILAGEELSTKKIFCWASFKNNGSVLCIHTDTLPPFQTW